ncbi:hypothetical protein DFH06DRAFT_1338075 [Mycena polygramma]|nr:hypothetical protein DFH06DRAFT_1338075 [Mycena polygramma]
MQGSVLSLAQALMRLRIPKVPVPPPHPFLLRRPLAPGIAVAPARSARHWCWQMSRTSPTAQALQWYTSRARLRCTASSSPPAHLLLLKALPISNRLSTLSSSSSDDRHDARQWEEYEGERLWGVDSEGEEDRIEPNRRQ